MLRRMLSLLAVTIGLIVTVVATSTTTAGAATFAYDAPAIARVGAHEPGPVEIGLLRLSGSRARFALPPTAAAPRRGRATGNGARGGLHLAAHQPAGGYDGYRRSAVHLRRPHERAR
jgi:hypothetical protein